MQKFSLLFIFIFIVFLSASAQSVPGDTTNLLKMLKTGKYSELLSIKKSSASGEEAFLYALAAYRTASYSDAASMFRDAAETFPLMKDYSLYYRAKSLEQTGEKDEALKALSELLKIKKESVLSRRTLLLRADILFSSSRWREAVEAYSDYISSYPNGADSLKASFNQAVSRINLGEKEAAVKQLSVLWLKSPASKQAVMAEKELEKLRSEGVKIPAFSQDELYRRAVALYDKKSYSKALEQFRKLSLIGKDKTRAVIKTGQALFKMRKFREAEEHFESIPEKEKNSETLYWLARSFAKNGRQEESIALYLRLVKLFPSSDYSDDALYLAAIMTREAGKRKEAEKLFQRVIAEYPKSAYYFPSLWETGLIRYLDSDYTAASDFFLKLLNSSENRERALFWLSKIEEKSENGTKESASQLLKEYPFGYYAYQLREKRGIVHPHLPDADELLKKMLAEPLGFEKEKFMISCGMNQEVQDELKKYDSRQPSPKTLQSLAWLYLNSEGYNNLYHLSKKILPEQKPESEIYWGMAYPPAYIDKVSTESMKNKVPISLAMAVMRSESSYSAEALSPAGAIGLMQIMPATAGKMIKASGKPVSETLKDPEQNIRLGVRHLKDLLERYNGEKYLALAAYNAGSGNLDRWRKDYSGVEKDAFIELIPYSETRNYVKKVQAASYIYQSLYPQRTKMNQISGTP